jgi:hypothetical protein
MRNTMLGHISLNVVAPATATANTEQMAFIQHSVELPKTFLTKEAWWRSELFYLWGHTYEFDDNDS